MLNTEQHIANANRERRGESGRGTDANPRVCNWAITTGQHSVQHSLPIKRGNRPTVPTHHDHGWMGRWETDSDGWFNSKWNETIQCGGSAWFSMIDIFFEKSWGGKQTYFQTEPDRIWEERHGILLFRHSKRSRFGPCLPSGRTPHLHTTMRLPIPVPGFALAALTVSSGGHESFPRLES